MKELLRVGLLSALIVSALCTCGASESDLSGEWVSPDTGAAIALGEDNTYEATDFPVRASGPNCSATDSDREGFSGTYQVIGSRFVYLDTGVQVWIDTSLFGDVSLRLALCHDGLPATETYVRVER